MGSPISDVSQQKMRCSDWLQEQNSEPNRLSFLFKKQNDIQFIVETNETRKKFLLSTAVDDESVPPGVDEEDVKPTHVPLRRLRVENLRLECEWQSCQIVMDQYNVFQEHVAEHIRDIHILNTDDKYVYVCLWDTCGHKSPEWNEIVRHVNYHAYHSKLLAIGFNARATLNLARCKKDSTKRNQLPSLKWDHKCLWIGCKAIYYSMQTFLDHVKAHINHTEDKLCSWAGCGAKFHRRVLLTMHVRSHTNERLIACYHCGAHFATNRKLCDHLNRQNAYGSGFTCTVCGVACATAYLLREHSRRHVSLHACPYCDMSTPTLATLAAHVRYRHMDGPRHHACDLCSYRAVTKSDLTKHMKRRHAKKKPNNEDNQPNDDLSDSDIPAKKAKEVKKYCCHMCPEEDMKIFLYGAKLTKHLVKVHGVQWPFGHSRFRYQISDDGMYRLTTTRYESLEVSKTIMERQTAPVQPLTKPLQIKIDEVTEATETSPKKFTINLEDNKGDDESVADIEITMCDVDEHGNVIRSEIITSDVLYRGDEAKVN